MGANDLYTIKGEALTAQAKSIQTNRVLLGAFDIVDTSNANYNLITRKTYVLKLWELEWSYNSDYSTFFCFSYSPKAKPTNDNGVALNMKSNLYKTESWNGSGTIDNCIAMSGDADWIRIHDNSLNGDTTALMTKLQGVILQYEVPTTYTEKVIKGVPILNLDQNGANWLRSEWEKGLNLANDVRLTTTYSDHYGYRVATQLPKGTYTLVVSGTSQQCKLWTLEHSGVSFYGSITFTTTQTLDIELSVYDMSYTTPIFMLVEGDHAYPYKPYSGAIVHEKEIESVAYKNVNNEFSERQTITSSNTAPIALKTSGSSSVIGIDFFTSTNTLAGAIGMNSKKPYFWSADFSIKPNGYLLTEDDIDSVPTDGSTKAVSSNGVFDSITTVTAIAEGKTKSYTIALSSNASFNTQADAVSSVSSITDISGNTINVSNMKNGDIILIIDLEVPDRWYSATDGKFYKMETSKVDLSGYLPLTGGTLTGNLNLSTGKHIQLDTTSDSSKANYISAGGGFSKNSGKNGIKIAVCDNDELVSGLGQDLSPNNYQYDLCVAGCNNSSDQGHITFVTHKIGALGTFRELGDFHDNAGAVTFTVNGSVRASSLYENNIALTDKYLQLSGGDMTGSINWAASSQNILQFAKNDSNWRGGFKYSWSSNTTQALWGIHRMSQFVWNAGADFSSNDVNGTTVKTYDFQIGRDSNSEDTIVRINGSLKLKNKATMQYNSNEDCIDFIFN